jgi:hypothetical protein
MRPLPTGCACRFHGHRSHPSGSLRRASDASVGQAIVERKIVCSMLPGTITGEAWTALKDVDEVKKRRRREEHGWHRRGRSSGRTAATTGGSGGSRDATEERPGLIALALVAGHRQLPGRGSRVRTHAKARNQDHARTVMVIGDWWNWGCRPRRIRTKTAMAARGLEQLTLDGKRRSVVSTPARSRPSKPAEDLDGDEGRRRDRSQALPAVRATATRVAGCGHGQGHAGRRA